MKARSISCGALFGAALFAGPLYAADPAYWTDIDFTKLRDELGAATPTGVGIRVGVADPTGYPSTSATHYGVNMHYIGSPFVGGHAAGCARFLYGDFAITNANVNGIGTGISNAVGWTSGGYSASYLGFSGEPTLTGQPAGGPVRVWSHSYVGNTDNPTLRRADYTVNRDQYSNIIGVQNDWGLYSAAYNSINVGLSTGAGNTVVQGQYDGAERYAVHLSAPAVFTSDAVPIVGAAAATLWQMAGDPANLSNPRRDAAHPETIKAIMMAGATKNESEFGTSWNHTSTHPLDSEFGAGELNIYNNYHIMNGGKQPKGPNTTAKKKGWDYSTVGTGNSSIYYLNVAEHETVENLSIVLTWNRLITPQAGPSPSNWDIPLWYLANLDLKLYRAEGNSLDELVDQSISWQYNHEHIYVPGALEPGRYAIEVSQLNAANSDNPFTTYALAWHANVTAVPEPAAGLAALLSAMLLSRRPRRAL